MPTKEARQSRSKELRAQGAAHRTPELVRDQLFQNNVFFDPQDLVQVKYEMLRRVQAEGAAIATAAKSFGFSRVSFYQIRQRFTQDGLAGLLPRLRGPKHAHKLSANVLAYLDQELERESGLNTLSLASKVRTHFGLSVHPRSIERALARRQKKRQS